MNLQLSHFVDQKVIDTVLATPQLKLPTHESIDALDLQDEKGEKTFKKLAVAIFTYSLVRNGVKYLEISNELSSLADRCPFTCDQYRVPYNPILLGMAGKTTVYGIYLTKRTAMLMDWDTGTTPEGMGFLRFPDEPYDVTEEDSKFHVMMGMMLRITTLCYHAGQLLEKLPSTGKTRRARALEQGHRVRMVQTVDWLTQRYAKQETVPTGRTVAPHERRGHSRCVGGRLIDVKPAIIHKDKFIGPTTTIIK